jgi:hypothetical protein
MSNIMTDALSYSTSGFTATVAAPGCAAVPDKAPFDLWEMALHQILCTQEQSLHSSKACAMCFVTQKVGELDLLGKNATSTFWPLVKC